MTKSTDPTHAIGHSGLGPALLALAWTASDAILAVRAQGLGLREKADGSPVTLADDAAEAIILSGLADLTTGMPIVSEEAAAQGRWPKLSSKDFWIVDPLDGTREFARGGDDFTVNIALVQDGVPALGVVVAPARGTAWLAPGDGSALLFRTGEAMGRPIRARSVPPEGATVLVSRSHMDATTEAWLADAALATPIAARTDVGSSLKFCVIAEGRADLYPRFGRTMEWDTAAGQAVLMAAGGAVCHPDGRPFRYGKPGFENSPFIARGIR